MKDAMNSIATYTDSIRARGLFLLISMSLGGCAVPTLPGAPVRPAIYDFGPGALTPPASLRTTPAAPLIVAAVEASPALDGTAILYRLAYTDARQLRPYAQARWSMPPADLVRQRLREALGQHRTLLNPGKNEAPPRTLRLELEEFSQLFETPERSVGLLRLRATLVQPRPGGEQWLAQRSFVVQRPAASANAPGGVQALTAATDAAAQEIEAWLQAMPL